MKSMIARWFLSALFVLAVAPAALIASPGTASAAAALHLGRAEAAANDRLTVSGSGYTPSSTVTVSADFYVNGSLRHVAVSGRTNGSGNYFLTLPIPAGTSPGSYRVTAVDAQKDTASQHLAILPVLNLQAGTKAPATPVAPNHTFFVRGSGYHGKQAVQIRATFPLSSGDSMQVARTATANANGFFQIAITVPAGARQTRVALTATAGKERAGAYVSVVPYAALQVGAKASTIAVTPGRVFYAGGSGFQAGENATLAVSFPLINGSSVAVTKTVAIDENGRFNATLIRLPTGVKQATISVSATGQSSHKQATSDVALTYHPSISLSSKTARPGGSVTVNGSGFLPNVQVVVTLSAPNGSQSTVTVTQNATTNANGSFSLPLNVPGNVAPGTYTVTARGTVSGLTASAKLTANLAAALSLSTGKVAPGQTVKVSGAGFTPNVAVTVSATFPLYGGGHHTVSQTVGADAHGNFTLDLTVPGHAAAGAVSVIARGPNTQTTAKLAVAKIGAAVWVTPSSTYPGATITVHGSGYPANDTIDVAIAVKMANGSSQTITVTAHTGSNGGFVKQVNLPGDIAVGTYAVVAKSELTGRAPSTHLTLAIHAGLTIKPASAQPGHSVTVTGGGFSAGVAVTVSATFPLYGGGSKTVSATVHSGSNGSITAHLAVPARAASGPVSVTASGPNGRTSAKLQIGKLGASMTVSPAAAIPGSDVMVKGSGYLANGKVDISATVTGSNGKARTLTATAVANGNGQFTATLKIPGDINGGTYTVVARGEASGRAPTAHLTISKLAPSIVASPTTAVPGTQVTVNGFGFAAGQTVTVDLQGQKLGTATSAVDGKFSVKVTIPSTAATGKYTVTATGAAGRSARISLSVQRQVSTHYYFASIYTGTGYVENLDFLNPTEIQARVTVTYMRKDGSKLPKTFTIPAHSRYTENVNGDIGTHVSASAAVDSDVPIIAERASLHGTDGSIVPGVKSPATVWYFANGNTSRKYREYIAVQNPNSGPVQVAFHLLPTHHRAITVYRTMPATSRVTIKVNSYVRDAVGVIVRSNGPVVANRTVFIHHGMASKIGVTAPQKTWYFAAGPRSGGKHWIGAINPNGQASYVTLHAYNPLGQEYGTAHGWVKANGRVGYLINRIAHGHTDAAVVLTASRPIVAEQMTYRGNQHNQSTDTFGVPAPAKSWGFAAVNTSGGEDTVLSLFNPSLAPEPVVVQFMTSTGQVIQRTYVVAPLAHHRIDVGSVVPNAQLGIVATSNDPFVVMTRLFMNGQLGSATSPGVQMA
jgi:5-hydroxyisourate hydrolase-like protein (transthyretin family)